MSKDTMKTIAMIQEGVVVNLALWDGVSNWNPPGYTLVDVTGQFVDLGYLYDGQNFSAPPTTPPSLADQASAYMSFGQDLFQQVAKQVWATNEQAAIQGSPLSVQQIETLLSESDTLQKALESGSLTTSVFVIQQLVASFPQYSTIGTDAINQITSFTSANPIK